MSVPNGLLARSVRQGEREEKLFSFLRCKIRTTSSPRVTVLLEYARGHSESWASGEYLTVTPFPILNFAAWFSAIVFRPSPPFLRPPISQGEQIMLKQRAMPVGIYREVGGSFCPIFCHLLFLSPSLSYFSKPQQQKLAERE